MKTHDGLSICLCKMADIRPTICNLVYDMTSLRKAQFCNAGWPRFGLQVATLYLLHSTWSVCNSAILPTKWYLVPSTPWLLCIAITLVDSIATRTEGEKFIETENLIILECSRTFETQKRPEIPWIRPCLPKNLEYTICQCNWNFPIARYFDNFCVLPLRFGTFCPLFCPENEVLPIIYPFMKWCNFLERPCR